MIPIFKSFVLHRKVEDIVRKEGGVPASIAIIKGNIHVGERKINSKLLRPQLL